MSKTKIQPTLFAFGVSKKIKHREEVVNVSLPLRAEEPIPGAYLCSHCPKRLKNTQGLSVHMKCTHNGDTRSSSSSQSNKLAVVSHKSTIDELLSEDVTFVMNSLIKNVEGRIAKHVAAKEQAEKKRHVYTAKFKVQVIEACDEEGATQGIVAEKFGIS